MNNAICFNCNTSFFYRPSDSTGKFCGRSCFIDYVGKNKAGRLLPTRTGSLRVAYPITCVICGKIRLASSKGVKHCSAECKNATFARNRKFGSRQMNGYKQTIYRISCLNCRAEKDAVRKTAKYCNSKCQLEYEYRTGVRDPIKTSEAAHEEVKRRGFPSRRGKPIPQFQDPAVWAKVSRTKTGRSVPKLQGPNNGNWTGGSKKDRIWHSVEYQAWRKAVMRRDNYTCIFCGDKSGGNLEADHIKPRYLFPELTFDVSNGRTLCKPCHKKTDTYGHKVKLLKREDFDLAA